MKFWKFSEPIQWHGKGFSLQWNIPGAWLVLVHFSNGEQKAWYRRTERSYRFSRWFWKKGTDRFRNIANYRQPFITLYIFKGFSLLPEGQSIPMNVRVLRVREPEIKNREPSVRLILPSVRNSLPTIHSILAAPGLRQPVCRVSVEKPPLSSVRLQSDFEQFVENNY